MWNQDDLSKLVQPLTLLKMSLKWKLHQTSTELTKFNDSKFPSTF